MVNAKQLVDTKIAGKKVVVFSKSYCPYCAKTKTLLKNYKLSADDLDVIEIDQDPYSDSEMRAIQDYLKSLTGASSVPRVFVGGKSVGGNDDAHAAHKSGKLKQMIEG